MEKERAEKVTVRDVRGGWSVFFLGAWCACGLLHICQGDYIMSVYELHLRWSILCEKILSVNSFEFKKWKNLKVLNIL